MLLPCALFMSLIPYVLLHAPSRVAQAGFDLGMERAKIFPGRNIFLFWFQFALIFIVQFFTQKLWLFSAFLLSLTLQNIFLDSCLRFPASRGSLKVSIEILIDSERKHLDLSYLNRSRKRRQCISLFSVLV